MSCVSADPRAPGRPWATAGAPVESHVARLFNFESPMCSVHSRLGEGIPATRAASCSAADCGRTASARSVSIGSIMRAPSSAIDHHRSEPSLEPILPRATKSRCFCGMLVAATTDPRRAALVLLPSLADSDPKARSALRIRKAGKSTQFTSSLARIGDTAQSVRASDTSDCRYQHPPAMAAKFRSSPCDRIYLFVLLLICFTAPRDSSHKPMK